ncbi:phage regulatory CII family protein [uncultured Xylophilus sp.]|uniref:phage regulatory CII family protein n=1 Tax=uncultured Xylophilus sp. TaxID=296832 RepID=UPI0025CF7354|nr:phage regulatory CII family protein [uncultured Xylophilus sp.]
MRATISLPRSLDHVAEGLPADSPDSLTPEDAAYQTAHGYPGGVSAIAARLGIPAGTLTHKVNPHNTTHHLSYAEAVSLAHLAGDARMLHAFAARLGYTCTKAMPDQAGGDPVEATVQLQGKFGLFMEQTGEAMLRSLRGIPPSRNDMRRCTEYAGDLIAAANDMLSALRGRMRPEPPAEG